MPAGSLTAIRSFRTRCPRPLKLGGAFTLIELLIVVAIIAILAAGALPNFLEARVRARTARVRSDLRTLATALESYAVDRNAYPPAEGFFDPLPSRRYDPLTSPVAYITAVPRDPFARKADGNYEASLRAYDPAEPLDAYLYNPATHQFGPGSTGGRVNKMSYSLTSGGPDLRIEFPYYAFADNFIESNSYSQYLYDPTNGTVSAGELFRRGGAGRRHVPGVDTW